jgi:hypothetical protein
MCIEWVDTNGDDKYCIDGSRSVYTKKKGN